MIDRFPQQLAGLATLAVAIVTAAFLLADGIRDIRRADDQIEVTGSARRPIRITPRFSTEVSEYGVNDTSSLEKDITAVVRVTFAIR
jgi:hypothetical protein